MKIKSRFIDWTRSVAMWIVWNVPCGRIAPKLMGYAMKSSPNKIK